MRPDGPAKGIRPRSFYTASDLNDVPAVAGGVVYVGTFAGTVYALNAATGAELWGYTTGGPVWSSPALANGVVYVSSEKVYALNAATGAKLWSSTTGAGSSPAVADGVAYAGGGHTVYAFDVP